MKYAHKWGVGKDLKGGGDNTIFRYFLKENNVKYKQGVMSVNTAEI
jgi:hypothetical protein